ncbi:MAG: hypothetical protein Q4G60_10730 [bacterium]|nr:hypothetical protein [bacterium]
MKKEEKKEIVLKNAIMVNGVSKNKFAYDENEITATLFNEAAGRSGKVNMGLRTSNSAVMELDQILHEYLGMAAIIAVNPDVDWMDLERIKGVDVIKIAGIGRNFITSGSGEPQEEEESEQSISGEPSVPTQKSTTPVSAN